MAPSDDLRSLPRFTDSWSYAYLEHVIVERDEHAIVLIDANGKTAVPCAGINLLLFGPGVSVTHAAMSLLIEHGVLVAWTGEDAVRCYAFGHSKARHARNLYHQATLWANPQTRFEVAVRMYSMRFSDPVPPRVSMAQLRAMEGRRVRKVYESWAEQTGVNWTGRNYKVDDWNHADPVNRALSVANSCLYGLCHAAILAGGFSPALGFVHVGNMLSFVYDIADLYKTEFSIPIAFQIGAQNPPELERVVRMTCRQWFYQSKLLSRVIPDIRAVLGMSRKGNPAADTADAPLTLWDPDEGECPAAQNYDPELLATQQISDTPPQQQPDPPAENPSEEIP